MAERSAMNVEGQDTISEHVLASTPKVHQQDVGQRMERGVVMDVDESDTTSGPVGERALSKLESTVYCFNPFRNSTYYINDLRRGLDSAINMFHAGEIAWTDSGGHKH